MNSNPNFIVFDDSNGAASGFDLLYDDFPVTLHLLGGYREGDERLFKRQHLPAEHTLFGFSDHEYGLHAEQLSQTRMLLAPNTYFAVTGPIDIDARSGFVVVRNDYAGLNMVGGPIEKTGRLNYIDGCTDSLLVPPTKLGDPCLNLLCFPRDIKQTMHTHPSNRIGMVASGRGRCITPHGEVALLPGIVFCIPKEAEHCFYTDDSEMRVVAWHPDSDYGPQDENHPMINRTMVDGESAATRDDLRTK
jgi:mannose-6-phosphate isomerase-like protein (cupin superfamily)